MLIVKKFGGTSVGDKQRMYNVANRCIEEYKKGNDVVVVLSAMGKYTDELIRMAHDMDELKKRVSDIGGKPMIFQKFIEKSSGFDVRLQVVGDEVVAAMFRYTDDGDFRANITHGGKMKSYEPDASEIKLATDTVKSLGLDFAGVDLLFSNGADMPADMVCEVNSNAHFKNIFECTGVNVADEIMKYIMSH